jgi:hypothetical protein
MPYKDPEKRRECRRNWYSNNRESEKKHVKRRKKEIKKWFNNYRSKLSCKRCKENHPATLDFHHKNRNNKAREVTKIVHEGYGKARIKNEISKCIVLCANCHRKEHYYNKL